MGWDSAGYEIGNTLARGTFPAARLKRSGPPPSGLPADFDPSALRGSPIRARTFAFAMSNTTNRNQLDAGGYVGPGLVKRLHAINLNSSFANPIPFMNIFHNTTPYDTLANQPLTALPPGTPILASGAREAGNFEFADEGGLNTAATQVTGNSLLLDYYIPDAQFFLALTMRVTAGQFFTCFGTLLVYEGVLITDFPAILG